MRTQGQVVKWGKETVATKHDNLDSRWEEIARLFRPSQLGFQSERTQGSDLESDVYDSLPIEQADRMARNLFAWIMNPAIRWFAFEWDDDDLKKDKEAVRWLEDSTKKTEKQLTDSNWSIKALQGIYDLVTFGSNMMQVDEKPSQFLKDDGLFRGLLFKAHHMSVSFGSEGADDFVHDTAIKLKFTARQAADLYGEESLPEKVKQALKANKTDKFEFVHAIIRRRLDAPPENETALPPNKRPYWSLHAEMDSEHVVREDGYYEVTRSMARYATTNDSVYGYSPAMKALPDARVINEAQKKDLDGWGKALNPPVKINSDKLKDGKINQGEKGVTDVDDMDAVADMPGKPDYQAHQIHLEDKRSAIRQIFLSDELDIPDRERVGAMTAFEIQKRIERILRSAGSVVTSIHTEMLQPMLFASFMLLLRRNVFDEVPKSVAEKGGENVLKVTFLGPLAKAQRSEDSDVIQAFVDLVVAIAGNMPPEQGIELLDLIDFDEAIRRGAESQGVPAEIVRDQKEVEKRRARRREQAAQALAAGAGQSGGQGTAGLPDS